MTVHRNFKALGQLLLALLNAVRHRSVLSLIGISPNSLDCSFPVAPPSLLSKMSIKLKINKKML